MKAGGLDSGGLNGEMGLRRRRTGDTGGSTTG